MKKLVFINDINLKASPRVRDSVCDQTVEEYAAAYKAKANLPPPMLFSTDGKEFLLADGRHRIEACVRLKRKAVECEVAKGDFEAALLVALLANRQHGLRRSNADKRKCVESALKQWPNYSNSKLSDVTGVDDHTVAAVRKSMEESGKIDTLKERLGKDNRKFKAEATRKDRPKPNEEEPEKPRVQVGSLDTLGRPIPSNILDLWNRGVEVDMMLRSLSAIKSQLTASQKNEDELYAEVNISATIGDLEKAWTSIQCAKPYAVCPTCQGHPELQPRKLCAMCKSRGFISKFRWDNTVPDELKKAHTRKVK